MVPYSFHTSWSTRAPRAGRVACLQDPAFFLSSSHPKHLVWSGQLPPTRLIYRHGLRSYQPAQPSSQPSPANRTAPNFLGQNLEPFTTPRYGRVGDGATARHNGYSRTRSLTRRLVVEASRDERLARGIIDGRLPGGIDWVHLSMTNDVSKVNILQKQSALYKSIL